MLWCKNVQNPSGQGRGHGVEDINGRGFLHLLNVGPPSCTFPAFPNTLTKEDKVGSVSLKEATEYAPGTPGDVINNKFSFGGYNIIGRLPDKDFSFWGDPQVPEPFPKRGLIRAVPGATVSFLVRSLIERSPIARLYGVSSLILQGPISSVIDIRSRNWDSLDSVNFMLEEEVLELFLVLFILISDHILDIDIKETFEEIFLVERLGIQSSL